MSDQKLYNRSYISVKEETPAMGFFKLGIRILRYYKRKQGDNQ